MSTIETSASAYQTMRADVGKQLQEFLRELIKFEHYKSSTVELDTFSLSVSKKFDQRMDLYEEQVHRSA
jgi:hypothetical protein